MDSEQLVELPALDELVTQYLKAPEAGDADAALARAVKEQVLGGRSHEALEVLAQHPAGAALLDDRLRFKLEKQRFLDLVEGGDPQQLKQALALAKSEVAPLALHAYPEAYQEFKHSLLRLLCPLGITEAAGQQSPVLSRLIATEPVGDARRQLAGMLFRTIREALGVADPPFTVLLRYLLLVHGQHAQQAQLPLRTVPSPVRRTATKDQGGAGNSGEAAAVPAQLPTAIPTFTGTYLAPAPATAATEGMPGAAGEGQDLDAECRSLLLPGREPMPLPPEGGEGAVTRFPESQVQALRNSLGCDREEAVALMRHAKGGASAALRSAVQATHLDDAAVLRLAQDYAMFRGLDAPLPDPDEAMPAAEPDSATPMDFANSSVDASAGAYCQQASAAQASTDGAALQLLAGSAALWDGATEDFAPPAKVARCGGRRSPNDPNVKMAQQAAAAAAESLQWEGRTGGDFVPSDMGALPAGTPSSTQQQGIEVELSSRSSLPCMGEREVHRVVRELRGLLEHGLSDEVEQQLEAACPSFCARHPDAVFLARRCHFLHLASSSPTAALAFVRSRLSPLALANPRLQPQLKSCLAAIMLPAPVSASAESSEGPAGKVAGLHEAAAEAAAAVHDALRQQYNIQEPRLLRLLGHLLVAHSAHFMAQRFKDSYEQELGIPQLRGPGVLPAAEQQWRAARQARLAPAVPHPARATEMRAAALEEGLLGAMGPDLFRQLRQSEGVHMPRFRAVAAPEEGGAGPAQGADDGQEQQEVGEEEEEDGAVEDMSESEGEEGVEGWQQLQPAEGAGGEGEVSEEAILLTQEFSGMARGQAIELLLLFGGSPQAVMAHLFP